jgi:hypothetical protein
MDEHHHETDADRQGKTMKSPPGSAVPLEETAMGLVESKQGSIAGEAQHREVHREDVELVPPSLSTS